MTTVRSLLAAAALAAVAGLGGCGSDGPIEAVSNLNPFQEEERPLPGDRRAVLTGTDPAAVAANRPAAIGAPAPRPDWPQPGGPATNDSGNVAAEITGARLFSVRAGRAEGAAFGFGNSGIRVSARPVSAGGLVYVYDPAGNVSAHALSSGGSAWRVNVRPSGESASVNGGGVALDGGRVFAGTGFGEVAALDATSGARAWTTPVDAPVRGAPTAAAGKVFVVTQAGTVTALDQATGAIAWTTSTSGTGRGLLAGTSPAVAGDTVVVPTSSGDVLALDIATGEQRWAASVIGGSRQAAVTGLQDASASPVVSDGVVYATGVGGRTLAVALADGETRWEQPIGGVHTPVVSGDAVFLIDLADRLVAFDRSDGTVLWSTRLPNPGEAKRASWAGPLLVGGRLWLVSASGHALAVDAVSGQPGTPGPIGAGGIPPITAGGRVLVLGADGTLVAIN